MTQYGTLRLWSAFLVLVGVIGLIAAGVGTIIWAFEVEGFWQTVGVLLIGGPVATSAIRSARARLPAVGRPG